MTGEDRLRRVSAAAVLALSSAAVCFGQVSDAPRYHLVLEGGTIYDGNGDAPYVADIGIAGNRVEAIGDLEGARAAERLDVSGLAVTPGFIDIHSHAVRGVFRHPLAENYTRQGVTTVIGGPDGSSPFPIAEFLARIELHPPAVNFGLTVGHGTIRHRVMGNEDRAPTEDELKAMEQLVEQAMREGAFGLSTGLKYVPGAYATTEEVIALARVAARFGGFHVSHMREEGLELLAAVEETIRIGEEGGLPTQLTHHKVVGAPMWGTSERSLALVDAARARGVDVTVDQYPYTASSTSLSILFPAWSLEGEPEDLLARLRDPDTRARIKAGVVDNLRVDRGGGHPKNVVISQCEWDPSLNGLSLADILAARAEASDDLQASAELALELQEKGGFSGIFHAMNEQDVVRIMRHPQTMIASDGGIVAPGEGVPHPRSYGTFARVLGHYARDEGVLSVAEAIRKMSSLPADRLGLADRGRLREGAVADIAVLDLDEVDDPAAFGDPHHYAKGARHVLVGGVFVVLQGEVTGARPGRALRRESSARRTGELPRVHVLATGGTIASAADGPLTASNLVEAIPELAAVAVVTGEDWSAIGSSQMTPELQFALAQRVGELFASDASLSGLVITHGTDSLEETAFLVDLLVADPRPVVFAAAQRSPRRVDTDGPRNLLNAVTLAGLPAARDLGVLVTLNDEVHAARDVRKTHSVAVEAFVSPDVGPLGSFDDGVFYLKRLPARRLFIPARRIEPNVDLVRLVAGSDGHLVRAAVENGARGLVVEVFGRGNVPERAVPALQDAIEKDVVVLFTTRTGGGRVEIYPPFDEMRVVGGEDLDGLKARVLLMVALGAGSSRQELQEYVGVLAGRTAP